MKTPFLLVAGLTLLAASLSPLFPEMNPRFTVATKHPGRTSVTSAYSHHGFIVRGTTNIDAVQANCEGTHSNKYFKFHKYNFQ